MTWRTLLQPKIADFIKTYAQANVSDLALKGPPDRTWAFPLVLDQIKAKQKAKEKLPQWLTAHPDLVFPPADIVEQASSAATARYKASLVDGQNFIDLTGGAGVDSWAFSQKFRHGTVIERNAECAALLAHNLPLLGNGNIEVVQADAENFIESMALSDFVYIDPQRRNTARSKIVRLEECSPDVTTLLPLILEKAGTVMVKASPMLDIASAVRKLAHVAAVHVVEWRGECREVLYILNAATDANFEYVPLTAVNIDDEGCAIAALRFTAGEENNAETAVGPLESYLFEPGPAFLKSGGFKTLALRFELRKLHPHTHLYTDAHDRPDFPGRRFQVLETIDIKSKPFPVSKANLAVRNFPADAAALKKRLKIKDGGEDYLFACTLHDESRTIIRAKKIDSQNPILLNS